MSIGLIYIVLNLCELTIFVRAYHLILLVFINKIGLCLFFWMSCFYILFLVLYFFYLCLSLGFLFLLLCLYSIYIVIANILISILILCNLLFFWYMVVYFCISIITHFIFSLLIINYKIIMLNLINKNLSNFVQTKIISTNHF